MTEATKVESVEDILEHFGTKGMKWGVRGSKSSTGVSRGSGALLDRNARLESTINKARSGEKHRVSVALGKKLIGAEQQQKNWNTTISNLHAQNARLTSGKTTIGDKLDKFASVGLLDLVVSVTPRG